MNPIPYKKQENSAHSYTEGSEVTHTPDKTVETLTQTLVRRLRNNSNMLSNHMRVEQVKENLIEIAEKLESAERAKEKESARIINSLLSVVKRNASDDPEETMYIEAAEEFLKTITIF